MAKKLSGSPHPVKEKKESVSAAKKPVRVKKKPTDPLELPVYLFHEGTNFRAYELLGAHFAERDGVHGVVFRTWAPTARTVSVIGNFNSWDTNINPCSKISVGIWETFIAGVGEFDSYKFSITASDGQVFSKADPYAFHAETRPATASKVYNLEGYAWNDAEWLEYRKNSPIYQKPVYIYELHMGSWKNPVLGEDEPRRPASYVETAEVLIPYVKEMGFTHIELMPIMEHPYDGSWGYQITGYFAPTSRYGTPKDFMRFVDMCHEAGIGVILDWAPAHFPKDAHGLYEFDGSCCYEYSDQLKWEHTSWGTRVFDFGRCEVMSFLSSSAHYWFNKYHIDGLRVDAVASMLYLDYSRQSGQWRPNKYGGRENLEAVSFLRQLNEGIFKDFPDAMMIAEESTAWPMITKPTYLGGLGFNLKWNMGWMNDTLHYTALDPYFRQYNHKDLTFSLMYAFSENYVLPISHDEVVHGKGSLINKMPGEYDQKFAGVRSFLLYMLAHPGKKHMFMGAEIGQFDEWWEERELGWELLQYPRHAELKEFFKAAGRFYLENPALWELDFDPAGFDWICHDDNQGNTVIFRRIDKDGGDVIIAINFSPINREGYRIGLPEGGIYEEIFNTDRVEFGGGGNLNPGPIEAYEPGWHMRQFAVNITIPPLGGVVLRRVKDKEENP